jgi:hypothetical protein
MLEKSLSYGLLIARGTTVAQTVYLITTWLDDRGIGVRVSVGSRILIPPYCPDRLWGQHNLLSNGYRRSGRSVKVNYDL